MRILKLLTGVLLVAGLLVTINSCEKQQDQKKTELTIELNNPSFSLQKKDGVIDGFPSCSDDTPTHVWVRIDDDTDESDVGDASPSEWYGLEILVADQTQVIKLLLDNPSGDLFYVRDMFVYKGTMKADQASEVIDDLIWAAPNENSIYVQNGLVSGLPQEFPVDAFTKNKISVDVLCFRPIEYDNFGFRWFDFEKYVVQNICFFGNIQCIDYHLDWHSWFDQYGNRTTADDPDIANSESLYPKQLMYDGWDFVAMFEVRVLDSDENIIKTIDNKYKDGNFWGGEGEPLCVTFLDDGSSIDTYTIEIRVWFADYCDPVLRFTEKYTDVVYKGILEQTESEGAFTLTAATGYTNAFFDDDQGDMGVWHFIWQCSDNCGCDPYEGEETAWAYAPSSNVEIVSDGVKLNDISSVFSTYLNNDGLDNSNNWGWRASIDQSLFDAGDFTITIPIIAAAGQNDVSGKPYVGDVTYNYVLAENKVVVEYQLFDCYYFGAVQTYCYNLAPVSGSPGQFDSQHGNLFEDSGETIPIKYGEVIDGLESNNPKVLNHIVEFKYYGGDYWIMSHGDVWGNN